MEEYKPNSHRSKEEEKKKVEKVVSGSVKVKQKNEVQKFANVFLSEDVSNVKSYVVMDVLVPAIKKAVSDIVTNGIDMILYGETGRSTKKSTASKISYRNFYDKPESRGSDSRSSRTRDDYDYGDIFLETKGEAMDVLSRMDEIIDKYEMVSVADLYDLVGITGKYTDNNYGWTDLRSADAIRVRDGYRLKFPKPRPLN